jgi:hypothetical protein
MVHLTDGGNRPFADVDFEFASMRLRGWRTSQPMGMRRDSHRVTRQLSETTASKGSNLTSLMDISYGIDAIQLWILI